jgi:hypothetical protein
VSKPPKSKSGNTRRAPSARAATVGPPERCAGAPTRAPVRPRLVSQGLRTGDTRWKMTAISSSNLKGQTSRWGDEVIARW